MCEAQGHIDAGAKKVIIFAPGKGKTLVMGVNHTEYDKESMNIGDPNFIGHYRMSLRTCEKKWDDDDKCVAFEYHYKVSKRCILTKAVTLVWYQLQGHRRE